MRRDRTCNILMRYVRAWEIRMLIATKATFSYCRFDEQCLVLFRCRIKNVLDRRPLGRRNRFRIGKRHFLTKPNDDDTFTFLRHTVVKRIQNLVVDSIPSILKMRQDNLKRTTSVVSAKIPNILQHERLWLFCQEYLFDIEKECTLRFMIEPLFVAYDRERLAREPAQQNIKVRD